MHKILIFIMLLLALFSCKSKSSDDMDKEAVKLQYQVERNPVEILTIKEVTFHKELVCTGKLKAVQKSSLRFRVAGTLAQVNVKNGDYIAKGDVMACLEEFNEQQAYSQALANMENATYDLDEHLIGQGYRLGDSIEVPKHIMKVARFRSGFASTQNNLTKAKYNLEHTNLCAPFSGIVANLTAKVHERLSGEEFCLLIDNTGFDVEFSVLESEYQYLKMGGRVQVVPFSLNKTLIGIVTEINPVISDNGLIQVKAYVENTGDLIEGMNANVLLETAVPKQMVVPKSAVLQRDNQEVVFRYTKGIAWWTYVKTVYENSTSYAIIPDPDKNSRLVAGDTIIVSGNLNLAHESKVEINE